MIPFVSSLIAGQVEGMIRRNVRRSFYGVNGLGKERIPEGPCIFVPNHHGWHDGYVMYLVMRQLNKPVLDWIAEYDAFPLFGLIGGMPFPAHDAVRRAQTIRQTIRRMRTEGRSLMLFAESELHRPPELREFGRALEVVAKGVPEAAVIPVAIRYEASLHERPEVFVSLGQPMEPGPDLSRRTRLAVQRLLDTQRMQILHQPDAFTEWHRGTRDVNERLDLRRFMFWRRR